MLVDIREPDDCWLWKGNVGRNGYGRFRPEGAMNKMATHRIALTLEGPPEPPEPDNHVLHSDRCVSKLCVNPRHLRWGSTHENNDDYMRSLKGEAHMTMTPEIVRYIRNSGETGVALAKKFNVSTASISLIRNRKQWAHVA